MPSTKRSCPEDFEEGQQDSSSLYVVADLDSTSTDPILVNDLEILRLQNNKLLKKVVELELQASNASASNLQYEQVIEAQNMKIAKYAIETANLESKLKDADDLITSLRKEIELSKNKN